MADNTEKVPNKRKVRFLKETEAVLSIAKRVKEESVFQLEPLYIRFKAKHDGRHIEIWELIKQLTRESKFYNEAVYWGHKVLSDTVNYFACFHLEIENLRIFLFLVLCA